MIIKDTKTIDDSGLHSEETISYNTKTNEFLHIKTCGLNFEQTSFTINEDEVIEYLKDNASRSMYICVLEKLKTLH